MNHTIKPAIGIKDADRNFNFKKAVSLKEQCENVFENILKGTFTDKAIAQVFSNLKAKGYNYSDIKLALLRAGDLEIQVETDIYTRQDLMKIFGWGDRALRNNLHSWGLPHLQEIYKKDVIHEAAAVSGWVYNSEIGCWQKNKVKRAIHKLKDKFQIFQSESNVWNLFPKDFRES